MDLLGAGGGPHLDAAQAFRQKSTSGLPIGEELIRATLEEMPAAMQTISAAAFSIDGFDGAVGHAVSLPQAGRPRAQAVLVRMEKVFTIPLTKRSHSRSELDWLFALRNQAVHAKVRKDRMWRHPSGLTVSAVQQEIGLESAERAVVVCRDLLRTV